MPHVLYPLRERLREHGDHYEALARIPIVLTDEARVHGGATAFLREVALQTWEGAGSRRLSANSIRCLAYDLVNFLDFCSEMELDWRFIERGSEVDLGSIIGYGHLMERGDFSKFRRPIGSATIKRRTRTAQLFLCYAGERGFRSTYRFRKVSGYGRSGSRFHLQIPARQAVETWLDTLERREHRANFLMGALPFKSGMRREEVVELHADDIPHPGTYAGKEFAFFTIQYGTKGQRSATAIDLIGKPRQVRIRSEFLLLLHAYKEGLRFRPAAIRRFRERNPHSPLPLQLFLNPRSGEPYSKEHLNDLFNRSSDRPIPNFTPHTGRHFYACWTLLELLEDQLTVAGYNQASVIEGAIESLSQVALLQLKKHLGHESTSTTDHYVSWVSEHLRLNGWKPSL
jgi:integrase